MRDLPSDLPAAPSALTTSTRPKLVLPPQILHQSSGAAPVPDAPEVCYAPATGVYAPQPDPSPATAQELADLRKLVWNRVGSSWFHNMPRASNDPWVRKATVTIRFAILPSGEVDPPVVTASSGRASFDHHALEAIRQAGPFDPLPDNITRPLLICGKFRYNVADDDWQGRPPDALAKPPDAKP